MDEEACEGLKCTKIPSVHFAQVRFAFCEEEEEFYKALPHKSSGHDWAQRL